MEIEQFRVRIKARNFERTRHFYGETLALAELETWETENRRGAVFQAGGGLVEVVGRRREAAGIDEEFEYRGPVHKISLTLAVPSAQAAYDDIIFRQKNIPGGLHETPDGATVFVTYDPDGVRIEFREG